MLQPNAYIRHRHLYAFGKLFVPAILRPFSYKTEVVEKLPEPCMILSNHLTEKDLFMVGSAFKDQLYFVCGEHLLRNRFLGPVLRHTFDPIPARRGGPRTRTVIEILKRLRAGNHVVLFPEGCRSFSGETLPVTEACAKLVQRSGAGLVTYRIHGGYFIAPRWAYTERRGHAEGEVVSVYSSDELKAMSVKELTAVINRDLYENAYEYQKTKNHPYTGRRPAEGMENYLLICPSCGKYDTLVTGGKTFRCSACGMAGEYAPTGMLLGEGLPFRTVYDWGKWMKARFAEDLASTDREPLFRETDVMLHELLPDLSGKKLAVGTLLIYRDRVVLEAEGFSRTFAFADMVDKSLLYFGKTFLFSDSTGYYRLKGEHFRALKVDMLCDIFKAAEA